MKNSLTLVSFVALILAIAAWGGVWFLFSDISTRLTERAQAVSTNEIQSSKQENATEMHALVSQTTAQRVQLDSDVSTDVVGIASQIDAAGTSAGVQTTIGSASVLATSAAAGVSQLAFVVQADGSFAQVWRAAQLFQSLPLASQVTELDFEEIPGSNATPQWQLTAHIDVLTSAQVSS